MRTDKIAKTNVRIEIQCDTDESVILYQVIMLDGKVRSYEPVEKEYLFEVRKTLSEMLPEAEIVVWKKRIKSKQAGFIAKQ